MRFEQRFGMVYAEESSYNSGTISLVFLPPVRKYAAVAPRSIHQPFKT